MGFLGVFFGQLLAKFAGMATFILALVVAAFAAIWLLGTDLGAWVFEQVMDVAIAALNAISFDFSMLNITQYIPGLPAETVNMMGLIGVGQSLGMIVGALVVRVLLQLVPFTRLGS